MASRIGANRDGVVTVVDRELPGSRRRAIGNLRQPVAVIKHLVGKTGIRVALQKIIIIRPALARRVVELRRDASANPRRAALRPAGHHDRTIEPDGLAGVIHHGAYLVCRRMIELLVVLAGAADNRAVSADLFGSIGDSTKWRTHRAIVAIRAVHGINIQRAAGYTIIGRSDRERSPL